MSITDIVALEDSKYPVCLVIKTYKSFMRLKVISRKKYHLRIYEAQFYWIRYFIQVILQIDFMKFKSKNVS